VTNLGPIATTDGTAKGDLQIPNDYNKEVTQASIDAELKAASVPAMADQSARFTAGAAVDKALSDGLNVQIQAEQGSDKSKWFSWVWTPPMGACSPVSGAVHGVELSLDYCGPVGLIRDIVGWLFALYGAITVYGQLFRRD